MKKTWGIGTACAVALTSLALPVCAANSTPDLGEILKALSRQAADRTTAVQGNLLVNGDFEEPVVQAGAYTSVRTGQSFPGWEVIGMPGGRVSPISGDYQQGGTRFNAEHGRQWLDLTGDSSNSPTGVRQSVRTDPGATYELVFYVGNVAGGAFGRTSSVELLVDGKSLGVATNDRSLAGQQGWGQFRKSCTASRDTTTIAFINRDPPSDNSNGLDNVSLTLAKPGTAATAPPAAAAVNVAGEYTYFGQGRSTITQTGDRVHGYMTWPPAGAGPHYELKGTVSGTTITGEWYSIKAGKGWYRWVAEVLPNGDLDFARSEDPIHANVNKSYLTKQQ